MLGIHIVCVYGGGGGEGRKAASLTPTSYSTVFNIPGRFIADLYVGFVYPIILPLLHMQPHG